MWTRTHSQFYPGVSAETIWDIWTDINRWPTWHGDLDYCKLEGAFEVGNHFMLKPKGAPAVKINIIAIEPGRSFTDCTDFWGAKMIDTHRLEIKEDGVLLSNKLVVTGPLRWLWILLVAKHVANTIPDETEALVRLAKARAVMA